MHATNETGLPHPSEKRRGFFRTHYAFLLVLLFFVLVYAGVAGQVPWDSPGTTMDSQAYLISGYVLKNEHVLTLYGSPTAWIMPGLPFIIACFIRIFGSGTLFFLALRAFFLLLGLLSLVGAYLLALRYCSPFRAGLLCLFLCHIEYVWTSGYVIATEAPYITCFIWVVYFTVMLANTKAKRYFWWMFAAWFCSILIRPLLIVFPFILVVYLVLKKYDIKVLMRQMAVGFAISLIFFVPWTIRNDRWFHAFIPVNYASANPYAQGSYQGISPPRDEYVEEQVLYTFSSDWVQSIQEFGLYWSDWEERASAYAPDRDLEQSALSQYRNTIYQEKITNQRLTQWIQDDLAGFLYNYLFYKPLVLGQFAMESSIQMGIQTGGVLYYYYIFSAFMMVADFALTGWGIYYILSRKRHRLDALLLVGLYAIYTVSMAASFSAPRYVVPLRPLRYAVMAWGLSMAPTPAWIQRGTEGLRIRFLGLRAKKHRDRKEQLRP